MIWLVIIVGFVLIGFGIIGCIVPILPGPLIAYTAVLLTFFLSPDSSLETSTVVILGIICLVITLLDNFLPIISTKKFGGSNAGLWGGVIGLIIGLFFGPLGIIGGPLFGAITGELLGGNSIQIALKSGFGSFMGFLAGTFLKLSFCIVLAIYFFAANWIHINNSFSSIFSYLINLF